MDTKTRLSVYESIHGIVGERTSPLPKATAFSLLFSYAGKDHKFVSKLTDIGGKLDRKKKEVYFDFTSAGVFPAPGTLAVFALPLFMGRTRRK